MTIDLVVGLLIGASVSPLVSHSLYYLTFTKLKKKKIDSDQDTMAVNAQEALQNQADTPAIPIAEMNTYVINFYDGRVAEIQAIDFSFYESFWRFGAHRHSVSMQRDSDVRSVYKKGSFVEIPQSELPVRKVQI